MRLTLLLLTLFALIGCKSSSPKTMVNATPSFVSHFAAATRVVFSAEKTPNTELTELTELTALNDVHDFFRCFEFVPFEKDSSKQCQCGGGPTVDVYAEDKKIGTFTLHHGESVRWNPYDTDLDLTEASRKKLAGFLKKHHTTNP